MMGERKGGALTLQGGLRPRPDIIARAMFLSQAGGVGKHQLLVAAYVGCCWMGDAMEVLLMSVLAPAVRAAGPVLGLHSMAVTGVGQRRQ